MCGLAGFIGKSKNPAISFELFTNLFVNTQVRGVDASGIYAIDCENNVITFKDGVPSEVLINYEDYIELNNLDINLLSYILLKKYNEFCAANPAAKQYRPCPNNPNRFIQELKTRNPISFKNLYTKYNYR